MNIQTHANNISEFNAAYVTDFKNRYDSDYQSPHTDVNPYDFLTIRFQEIPWKNTLIERLKMFDKVIYNCQKPFINVLKNFFRTDCTTSVILADKTCCLLMGNERILFPHHSGDLYLCITPYFIKDPSVIHLKGSTDNIYPYRNSLMFLDKYQIPFPGGNYYTQPSETKNQYYRICFITKELKVMDDYYIEWNGKPNVFKHTYCSNSTYLSFSKFINPLPISNFNFPDAESKKTGLVLHRLSRKDPNMLIQDILNSYREQSRNSLENIGLLLEYPFEWSYEDTDNYSSILAARECLKKQYVAFSINGLPKTFLEVSQPYDRYFIHENYNPKISEHLWTNILYETEILPFKDSRVIIDNTVIGYKYKNAFLCLCHPALNTEISSIAYNNCTNTDCLLSPITDSDIRNDPYLSIIGMFPHDSQHKLYRIKHRNIRNDLWCLSRIEDNNDATCTSNEPLTKYPKKANPPILVRMWLNFYDRFKDKFSLDFGNLDIFKLAIILAKHRICFKLTTGKKREIKYVENRDEYEICVEKTLIDFIHSIRLVPDEDLEKTEKEDEFCSIM